MEAVTLVEFIEARIAEDEAMFTHAGMDWPEIEGYLLPGFTEERALAECAARRAVIALYRGKTGANDSYVRGWHEATSAAVRALVQPYAAHPDFNPAWAAE